MAKRCYYETLSIERTASDSEIRRARMARATSMVRAKLAASLKPGKVTNARGPPGPAILSIVMAAIVSAPGLAALAYEEPDDG